MSFAYTLHSQDFGLVVHRPKFSGTSLYESYTRSLDLRGVYIYLYFERLVHTAMIYDSH